VGDHLTDPEAKTKAEKDIAEGKTHGRNIPITTYANEGSATDSPTTCPYYKLSLPTRDQLDT
jgi:hypothetical protein